MSTTNPTIKNLGLLALDFARAAKGAKHCQTVLDCAYDDWRENTGNHEFIERGSKKWNAMMEATKPEYRDLQSAKSRERRAKAKLLALANKVKG
ncbi:MAG: hypothetical protein LBV14_13465 [Acidovorax sp.]|jgi:hypothetical protein|nr:hypothetical protein [Acidovorax sp.]